MRKKNIVAVALSIAALLGLGSLYALLDQSRSVGLTDSEDTVPLQVSSPFEPCPRSFEPVCSVTGTTYNNECLAKAGGEEVAYQGGCVGDLTGVDGCAGGYGPVCGKDGRTYEDTCSIPGDEVSYIGPCEQGAGEVVEGTKCEDAPGFVCGANGMTFLNECLARAARVEVTSRAPCR